MIADDIPGVNSLSKKQRRDHSSGSDIKDLATMVIVACGLCVMLVLMAVVLLAIAYWYISLMITIVIGYCWYTYRKNNPAPVPGPTDTPGTHQIISVREIKTNTGTERVKTVTTKNNRTGWDLVLDLIGTLTRH